ncbi:BamA/TamA family outer membrane protein [Pontibacter chitinilyticus]|uniref:translocation and assembly module lipoprotein TamL n=1 Tax=Pontibacter chitinilyticus TaxID=2674989 RepID=UPI00321BBA0A
MPTQHLGKDEQLLVQIQPKGLKHVDAAAIEALYQQEPNRMILGTTPYLWLYYFGKKFYDPAKIQQRINKMKHKIAVKVADVGADSTKARKIRARINNRISRLEKKKKEGNFLMQVGEPPAIYDSTLMAQTIDQINIYLNSKGYFNHQATYQKKVKKDKLVYITLLLQENDPYRYSELNYRIPDKDILQLVRSAQDHSLLKPGEIYDEDVLTLERDRLYELLKNNGYYDFARAYIEFEVDTTYAGHTAQLRTIIQNPEEDSTHHVYSINKVYFKTDNDRFGVARDTLTYNNIKYISYDLRYSPKVLDKKVDIYPGQRYSQLRTSTTQRKLADLDVFQFNNVLYNKVKDPSDSLNTYKLNAFINAIPSKKYQETAELGLNFTERQPGPFSSLNLRIRNIFGGAENLDFGLHGGFEGQISLSDPNQTSYIKQYGADVALTVPTILLPFGGRNVLVPHYPRTRIIASFDNVNRDEYKRTNYQLNLDYIWQRGRSPLQAPTLQYIFSPVNLSIVQANITEGFRQNLIKYSQGSLSLLESFKSAFLSYMAFNVIYNTNDFNQTRNARYMRTQLEVGGLSKELGLNIRLGNLQTFQYAKINPDFRRYIPLGNQQFFVYRINAGVASPLFNTDVLPYDKYFFAGGASSVRAWQSRRLGPGSYATEDLVIEGDQLVRKRDYSIEQPGEVLLEGSAEYRFNIFSFLNGALFVDAGNVWWLKKDEAKPGADFAFNRFYKELAVGTGFGIRFDLSVVVLRFDLATKVYDPAGVNGNKFVLDNFKFSEFFTRNNQSSLNIGIGYPF